MEHIANLPKQTLIAIKEGTVIVNNRVIKYPSYDGTVDGMLTYYAQISDIYQWSPATIAAIIGAISFDYKLLNDKGEQTPFAFGEELPARPISKGILWYGIGMLIITIAMNVALIGADKHITWNITTHFLLMILTIAGLYGATLCFWSYYSAKTVK